MSESFETKNYSGYQIRKLVKIQSTWRKYQIRKNLMCQVHNEYIKIFNQIEFEIGINRINREQNTETNSNLMKRPIHYKFQKKARNEK